MQTHTPGPWCVAPLDGVYHGDESTKYHAVKKFWPGPGAYERIADCTDSAYPEANAKLIAAAPDLLEALQSILHHSHWGRAKDGNELEDIYQLAAAAIAKVQA